MRFFYTFILLFCFSISTIQLQAQEQRFKAGVIVGLNASQLDGDSYYGYNKLGLVVGLSGVILLTEKVELNLELLFSQRGSTSSFFPDNTNFPFKISTDFIEIPLLINYKDWLDSEGEYYKLHFHGGFSYGRLINSEVSDGAPWEEASDEFNKNDWSYMLGATFYTGQHLAFTFRWSRSFGALYINTSVTTNAPSLQNHLLSFRTLYMF